ncbi:MAG TPA: hypothetical protein VHW44_02710 [Pseudonocardiaceae bacterium]|nr:hypothetical protein [Pseudonocardiaceae bacterium]
MSWQDELRQLDEELAAGRVSAQDYRTRRDALLAQSVGGFGSPASGENPQQPNTPPGTPPSTPPPGNPVGPWTPSGGQPQPYPQPGAPPQQPQYGQQYPQGVPQFPPNPYAQQQPPQPSQSPQVPMSERTQTIGPVSGNPPSAEATQVVRQGEPGDDDNPERTQVVSGINSGPMQQQGPRPGGGGGWTTDPSAGRGGESPWAGMEFPPLRPNEPWYAQGPEAFDSGGGHKGRIFLIVGIVVVVAAIVVGLVVLKPFSSGSKSNQAGGTTTSTVARPTVTTTTSPPGPIASITGTSSGSDVHKFDDVVALDFLSQDEVNLYKGSGPINKVYFALVESGQNKIVILLVQKGSATVASQIASSLAALQITYNMTAKTGGPTGVSVQAADGATGGPLRRAEYASNNYVVYLQVQGPAAGSADDEMTSVLQAQLAKLPASTQ